MENSTTVNFKVSEKMQSIENYQVGQDGKFVCTTLYYYLLLYNYLVENIIQMFIKDTDYYGIISKHTTMHI